MRHTSSDHRAGIRVGIADPNVINAIAFSIALETAPDLRFVGGAANTEQAVALVRESSPHVFLVEASRTDRFDGMAVTREVRRIDQRIKVLMVTHTRDMDGIAEAIEVGASGFFSLPHPITSSTGSGPRATAASSSMSGFFRASSTVSVRRHAGQRRR